MALLPMTQGEASVLERVPEELAADPAFEEAMLEMLAEARILTEELHPGIARVLSLGQDDRGFPYVVTRAPGGASLREHLARGPLGQARSIEIAEKIAEALQAAHEAGVIHRGLHPSCIHLREPAGESMAQSVMLRSFGLGALRLLPSSRVRLSAKSLLDLAPYLAPESCLDGKSSIQADVYALGAILVEMLSGQPPFTGDAAEILSAQVHSEPALPQSMPMRGLLARMLSKDPQARPLLTEVLDELAPDRRSRLPAPPMVEKIVPSGKEPPRNQRETHLGIPTLLVVGALLLVSLLLWAFWPR